MAIFNKARDFKHIIFQNKDLQFVNVNIQGSNQKNKTALQFYNSNLLSNLSIVQLL